MNDRKSRISIIATAVCVVFLAACIGIREINLNASYNEAVECLSAGDYTSALEIFECIGSYRDSRVLKSYATALRYAESASGRVLARSYISQISESYRGELCDEIRSFKNSFGSDVMKISQ